MKGHRFVVLGAGTAVVALVTISWLLAAASPGAGSAAHYGVDVSIAPVGDQARAFECTVAIRDLDSGQSVASPKLLSRWGERAEIETRDDASAAVFTVAVLVDSEGRVATYSADLKAQGRLVSSHKGRVQVGN